MLICFDIGNTLVHGGFYNGSEFSQTFRFDTKIGWSSDQLGIFLKAFCRENQIDPEQVTGIVISSVVPSLDYHFKNAARKYFKTTPLFVKAGVKTGISIKYKSPNEIGADLICSAVGATALVPDTNLIIIDMGTATTVTAVSAKKEFITGLIIPGPQAQAAVLASGTEKLYAIDMTIPKTIIANNTTESMQYGIYYAHLGGLQLMTQQLAKAAFGQIPEFKTIATGGIAKMFKEADLFDYFDSELVLKGLVEIYKKVTTVESIDKPFVV